MSITIYQSTDTDAPILTGQAGALKTLLKACLVAGYGTTPGKGWTLAFEDTNKIALKSSATGASGCVLRIDDSNTGYAALAGYHAMTDIDTGTGAFGNINQRIRKWYQGSATAAKAWTVIASDAGVYVFTQFKYGQTFHDVFFFGDFTSFVPSDNFNCLLAGDNSNSVYESTPLKLNNSVHRCAADASGLVANASTSLQTISDVTNSGAGNFAYPSTMSNGAAFFPSYLKQNFASSWDYRGVMPGLMFTPFAVAPTVADHTILSNVAGLPTGQRLLIKHVSNGNSTFGVGINIDEWL